MLDAAFAAGIRYFDTARSYGLAERFLAAWLDYRAFSQDALTVGSKWGYTYTGAWQVEASEHEHKDLSIATLRRQFGESRDMLGDHLNLYQIHSATLESGVLDDVVVLRELARLRSEGLAVGLTASGPRQDEVIKRALDVRVDGVNPFQSIQATWNLLEPSAGPALAEAKAQGWGVIVKEALANGRLTDRHAGPELHALTQLARTLGTAVHTLSIAAALNQPWVDVVLSGAVTTDQLRGHLAASALSLESVEIPTVAESPQLYWSRRSEFAWK